MRYDQNNQNNQRKRREKEKINPLVLLTTILTN